MTICRVLCVVLLAGFLSVMSTGCSSTSVDALRADPSPSMVSLDRTWQENENLLVRNRDLAARQIVPDINSITLQDRPRRMSIITVP